MASKIISSELIISFPPGSRVAPPPGVDCGPVGDVENDEQNWEHAEEYQVCPGKSENSRG